MNGVSLLLCVRSYIMRIFKYLLTAVLGLSLAGPAFADTVCETLISYKWERNAAQPGSTPVPATETVNAGSVSAAGSDEARAKGLLEKLASMQKSRALAECKRLHESTADCLSSKYSSMSSVLNSLRFEARKSLEEAIASDFAAQRGLCREVVVSEPRCTTAAAVEASEDEKAAEGGKGKEGGKAEEKKKK